MRTMSMRALSFVLVWLVAGAAFAESGGTAAAAAPAAAKPALDRDGAVRNALLYKNKHMSGDGAARSLKGAGASAPDALAGLKKAGFDNKELGAALNVYPTKDLIESAKILRDAELSTAESVGVLLQTSYATKPANVANALMALNVGTAELARAFRENELSDVDVAKALSSLDSDDKHVAKSMFDAEYPPAKIAAALRKLDRSITSIVVALKGAGVDGDTLIAALGTAKLSAGDLAKELKNQGSDVAKIARALQATGYSNEAIGTALDDLHASTAEHFTALLALGQKPGDAVATLHAQKVSDADLGKALFANKLATPAAIGALRDGGLDWAAVVAALRGAGITHRRDRQGRQGQRRRRCRADEGLSEKWPHDARRRAVPACREVHVGGARLRAQRQRRGHQGPRYAAEERRRPAERDHRRLAQARQR
jgi:hypothetical protein